MATKIKKSSKSSKRAPAKKSFFKNRLAIMFTLLFVLGLGAWGILRSMAVPSDINLVGTEVSTQKLVTDANGCYYQPVQCVKAPCEPIKVCPTTTTTTNNGIPFGCTTWFDGCNTCQVSHGILGGCTKKACSSDTNDQPKPYCMAYETSTQLSPIPEPVICAQDMYACPGGAMVARSGSKCEFICPSPKPVPSIAPNKSGIASLSAQKPCANNSFLSINFRCKDGRQKDLASGVCTNLVTAIKYAESTCNEVTQ